MFGDSVAMSSAIGRQVNAQSGCQSFGCQLTGKHLNVLHAITLQAARPTAASVHLRCSKVPHVTAMRTTFTALAHVSEPEIIIGQASGKI